MLTSAVTGETVRFQPTSTATTYATWTDWLAVQSAGVSYVRYDFAVVGRYTPSTDAIIADFIWKAFARGDFAVGNAAGSIDLRTYFRQVPYDRGDIAFQYPALPSDVVQDSFSTLMPVENGRARLAYALQAQAGAGSEFDIKTVEAQFTGGVTGVTFFDADMNELTNVTYDFENGTRFYKPPTRAVPEPGSVLLTLSGLVFVSVLARRRVRPAALP